MKLDDKQRDTERGILNVLLRNPEHYADIERFVRGEYFVFPAHRLIFAALIERWTKGAPIDLSVLADDLQVRGQLDAVGGYAAILELWHIEGGVWATPRAQALRDAYLLRQMREVADALMREASSPTRPAAEALEDFQGRLMSLESEDVCGRPQSVRDVAAAVLDGIARARAGTAPMGIQTGFHDFDFLTRGLRPGQLVAVAGRPGDGKTVLLSNMAVRVAESGCRVLICSLEMLAGELGLRMFSARADVDTYAMTKDLLSDAQWDALVEARDHLGRLPITFADAAQQGIGQIVAAARKLKATVGLDAVFVDYLQLVRAAGKSQNRQEEVAGVSRALKGLAMDLGIAVVAAVQLNRASVVENRPPRLTDLRDSGQIEQDCDIVGFLYAENSPEFRDRPADDAVLQFEVAKHRGGQTGKTRLLFRKKFSRFENMAFED